MDEPDTFAWVPHEITRELGRYHEIDWVSCERCQIERTPHRSGGDEVLLGARIERQLDRIDLVTPGADLTGEGFDQYLLTAAGVRNFNPENEYARHR
jgi:hypothetical protein